MLHFHVFLLITCLGRDDSQIKIIEEYLKAVGLFRDYTLSSQDPVFSQIVELDLSTVVPSVSGPKRPHDRVAVSDFKEDFIQCLNNKVGYVDMYIACWQTKGKISDMCTYQ